MENSYNYTEVYIPALPVAQARFGLMIPLPSQISRAKFPQSDDTQGKLAAQTA